jgi:tRNA(Ser,Leu) C12 N-acetylase TAN1
MSEERRKMLKEMIEQSVNPVGWLGYHEGLLVSFLQTQEQVESFLKNTDTAGKVLLVYTHPMRELTDEEILQFQDKVPYTLGSDLIDFARAILRKASEK